MLNPKETQKNVNLTVADKETQTPNHANGTNVSFVPPLHSNDTHFNSVHGDDTDDTSNNSDNSDESTDFYALDPASFTPIPVSGEEGDANQVCIEGDEGKICVDVSEEIENEGALTVVDLPANYRLGQVTAGYDTIGLSFEFLEHLEYVFFKQGGDEPHLILSSTPSFISEEPPPPPPPKFTDLALEKTVDNSHPYLYTEVTYTLTITNNGPDDAMDVTISDVLSPHLKFLDFSYSDGSNPATYDPITGIITVDGPVMVDSTHTYFITVKVIGSNGPVAWWSGDMTGNDRSGNYDSSYSGGYTEGKFNDAFLISDAGVEVQDSPNLNPTYVSVAAWVNSSTDPGQFKYIVAKGGDGEAASYALYTGPNGGLYFYVYDGSGNAISPHFILSPGADASLWDGQWHFVVGTFDGNTVSLYVDGILIGSTSAEGFSGINYGLDHSNLFIGEFPGIATLNFQGGIDEVQIYDRVLTDNEVLSKYQEFFENVIDNTATVSTSTEDTNPDNDTDSESIFLNDKPKLTEQKASGMVEEDNLDNQQSVGYDEDGAGSTQTSGSLAPLVFFGEDGPGAFKIVLPDDTFQELFSKGVPLSYSILDDVLTATADGRTVFTLKVEENGNYIFTLEDQLDHEPIAGENYLVIDFGSIVKFTDSNGDEVGLGSHFDITVQDDVPIASDQSHEIFLQPIDTNLVITLDLSFSMSLASGIPGLNRLDVAKQAGIALIDQYLPLGDVKVMIVTFHSTAAVASGTWVDAATAKTIIEGLNYFNATQSMSSGYTNYDAALSQIQTAFNTGEKIAGAQNINYFLSDGEPTLPANSLGINVAEENVWKAFLGENAIKSFALGMGPQASTPAALGQLNPIAWDGINDQDMDAIGVFNFSELAATLTGTVSYGTVSGVLDFVIGADETGQAVGPLSGNIKIEIPDDRAYTYDRVTDTVIVTGTGSTQHSFNSESRLLTVFSASFGSFVLNVDTGEYIYNVPGNISIEEQHTQAIHYTVIDYDGDTATATLTMNINPNAELIEQDDKVAQPMLSESMVETTDRASFANDTDDKSPFDTSLGDTKTKVEESVLTGGEKDDVLNAKDSNTLLIGGEGNDILNGGDGDDTLRGGPGDDIINGGRGINLIDFSDGVSGIKFTLTQSSDPTTFNTGDAGLGTDVYRDIQGVIGTNFDDVIVGSTGNDVIQGNGGADNIDITSGGQDRIVFTAADAAGPAHTVQITGFTTGTGADADMLDLSKLLDGVSNSTSASDLANY
ncbi:MAG: VWA domain-containing protein, partial [Gammaproteobacteria bacterium]|nr:VWA domain-containing protein [Gammaproteobacteria bacterium]